jgi:hypothetical protein
MMELARLPSLGTAETSKVPERVRKLASDYLPGADTANRVMDEFLRKCEAWKSEEVEELVVGLQPLTAELSKDEIARERYARSYRSSEKYAGLGPRWGVAISLAVDLLPTFKYWMDLIQIEKFKTASGVSKALKELTSHAKKYGKLWDSNWPELVNGELLGGYLDAVEMEDFLPEIRAWVEGDKRHYMTTREGELDEGLFMEHFRIGMRRYLSNLPNLSQANTLTKPLSEWVREPGNWARSGSTHSDEQIRYLTRKGTWKTVGKTKWRTALAMSPDMVERWMRTGPLRQTPKVIQKRERGKVRGVISSDDLTYLRQAYLFGWLELALKGNIKSTLSMSNEDALKMWEYMPVSNKQSVVNMPLDQAHFDFQQNFDMIEAFYEEVDCVIKAVANPAIKKDLLSMSALSRAMSVTPSVLDVEGHRVEITKGILSGWRGTATIDTAMNLGESNAAQAQCDINEVPGFLIHENAQGDDDDFRFNSVGRAVATAAAYQMLDFEINPGKFWVETGRNEYLRKYSDEEKVSGYPLRALGAILWRNPITIDQPKGLLRMTEQVRAWEMLMARGGDRKKGLSHMYRDIGRGNSLSLKEVKSVLRTPASAGGVGYTMELGEWRVLNPGVVKKKIILKMEDIKGLSHEVSRLEELGLVVPEHKIMLSMGENLLLRDAEQEVVHGTVEETVITPRFYREPEVGFVPLSARAAVSIPITLSSLALDHAVSEKRWEWIEDVWLDQDLRWMSDQIRKNGRRRCWVAWLQGKLPFHAPIVHPFGTLQVTTRHKRIAKGAWAKTIKRQFNWLDVRRAAVGAEEDARIFMLKSGLPIVTD